MSVIDPSVTNEAVIPMFQSEVFAEHPNERFAMGILAANDQALPDLEREYGAYYNLRRNVYVEQTGQLDRTEIGPDGTDKDHDDSRSIAFGILENRTKGTRLVAAARLIIKGAGADLDIESIRPLPVEEFCPDLFADTPVPEGGVEVSRFISRHEDLKTQRYLKWQMYAVALAHVVKHELGPVYAIIEPWLEKEFKGVVPVQRIGEPRYVEHYLDENLPVEIDTHAFKRLFDEASPGAIEQIGGNEGSMMYFGKLKSQTSTVSASSEAA